MPETFILNPTPTHPLNPDYSYARKRPVTHVTAKANVGAPYFREMSDVMHQFVLTWGEKDTTVARELKRIYEQYRDGFFTFIDHEDGGRHYVGTFTSPVEPVPIANRKWAIQQVTFDEIPGVPMLKYPSRWEHDAIMRLLQSDYGEMKVYSQGLWYLTAQAAAKSGYVLFNAGTLGELAAYQYSGYGFQMWAPTGPAWGEADIYLDGALVGTMNQNNGAGVQPSAMLFSYSNVPLGLHVVSIMPHTSGTGIVWDALKVMR